jgi:hypothetical protein
MKFEICYDIRRILRFCVIDMPYDLKFVIDIPYERNDYTDTSCPDAPVPPHLPILTFEHRKETHVKQSRHPSMAAHAYYYCPYKSMSNNIPHV